jgi:hypothetical protein
MASGPLDSQAGKATAPEETLRGRLRSLRRLVAEASLQWLPWRHKERTEKLLSMHLVVPWNRVALGSEVRVLPGKPVPNPAGRP